MQNADDEYLASSEAGQPRRDCPYLNNSCSVGAGLQCQPLTYAITIISSKYRKYISL